MPIQRLGKVPQVIGVPGCGVDRAGKRVQVVGHGDTSSVLRRPGVRTSGASLFVGEPILPGFAAQMGDLKPRRLAIYVVAEYSLEVWPKSELSTGKPRSEVCSDLGFCLSGWGDLNSRPSVPQFRQSGSSRYQRVPKSASEVGFYKIGVTSRTCG